MLTVDFIQRDGKQGSHIVVNGITDSNSYYSNSADWKTGYIYDDTAKSLLTSQSHETVKGYFDKLDLFYIVDWWDYRVEASVYYADFIEITAPVVQINLLVETEEWSKAWSISEFAQALDDSIRELGRNNVSYFREDEHFVSNGFGVEFSINNINNILKSDIDNALAISKQLVDKTVKNLISRIDQNSLTTFFQSRRDDI